MLRFFCSLTPFGTVVMPEGLSLQEHDNKSGTSQMLEGLRMGMRYKSGTSPMHEGL